MLFSGSAPMPISLYELNYCQNGFNLMIKKAHDKDEEAVEALAAQGASLWDAIYGYALGGHKTLVKKLLDQNPKLLSAAATGYAHALNISETTKLTGIEWLKPNLAYGFALAGDETQIRAALNSREGTKYLPLIIKGLACANHTALLLEIVAGTRYYSEALKAAAKSGHHNLVTTLLNQLSIHIESLESSKGSLSPETRIALGYVLEGYTTGRHFTQAASLLNLGINPMICLNSLSSNGELDHHDAGFLLSAVKEPKLNAILRNLMESQFGFQLDTLNLKLKNPLLQSSEYDHQLKV
jgi:hypothetical protein